MLCEVVGRVNDLNRVVIGLLVHLPILLDPLSDQCFNVEVLASKAHCAGLGGHDLLRTVQDDFLVLVLVQGH